MIVLSGDYKLANDLYSAAIWTERNPKSITIHIEYIKLFPSDILDTEEDEEPNNDLNISIIISLERAHSIIDNYVKFKYEKTYEDE
jgi:hypothetical protein